MLQPGLTGSPVKIPDRVPSPATQSKNKSIQVQPEEENKPEPPIPECADLQVRLLC